MSSCPGCLVAGSSETVLLLLGRSTVAWSAMRRSMRGGRERGGREGVWSTWVTKGAVKTNSGKAIASGEV